MNRCVWTVACIAALSLTTTVWSQSNSSPLPDDDAGIEALSSLAQLADGSESLTDEIRAELADLVVGAIHDYFSDIRAQWGLTAMGIDPLAVLEEAIVEMVDQALRG